ARWVVDASGRTGLLRRRFGTKEGTEHAGNSGWFRIDERIDMSELVASPDGPWHERALSSARWRSTNHLMGQGYWVWLIALPKERMSIGVVTHDAVHGFERVRTLPRVMAFFEEHEPALAARLANTQVLDFRCIKAYSYGIARSWSAQRWAIVGEAGAF